MNQQFTKYFGRITENLELGFEEKWIYVHYTKGSLEKTACLLKNGHKYEEQYLENFFEENNCSEEIKKEVRKFLKNKKNDNDSAWSEFSSFLMKTLSLNMVFGITIIICVLGGYKLGSFLDNRYHIYPFFTLSGVFAGIGLGGLTIYSMIQKYFKSPSKEEKQNRSDMNKTEDKTYPVIDVSMDEVRKAVREFSDSLPKGVYRTILVLEDNSIDFKQLAHLLGGIPSKKYYMSKETYDLFEENEKQIPIEMDLVQKAVDQYVKEHKEYPMLRFDPHHRVNYYQLLQEHYLKTPPETQFYITDLDGLITHTQPQKKTSSHS